MPGIPPRWAKRLDTIVHSLWLAPALITLGGILLGIALPLVDLVPHVASTLRIGWIRNVIQSTPSGAENLLSSSASALATILGVAFSLTLVTLQLAAGQYTTRLLGRLLDDRVTKVILGTYIGTVAYLLLVLRVVRSSSDASRPYVPLVSVSVGIVLVVACLGFLAYFLNHLGHAIQAATIVTEAGRNTVRRIRRLGVGSGTLLAQPPRGEGTPYVIEADQPGYVVLLDGRALLRAAPRGSTLIHAHVRAGEFVLPGGPLLSVWPPRALERRERRTLRDAVALGHRRTEQQDVLYGVEHLVDVALKALSPAMNDVTTAVLAVNELGAVACALIETGVGARPSWRVHEHDGVRVVLPQPGLDQFLDESFRALCRVAADQPRVLARVVDVVTHLARRAPSPPIREALVGSLQWVHDALERDGLASPDRDRVGTRLARARRTVSPYDGDQARDA